MQPAMKWICRQINNTMRKKKKKKNCNVKIDGFFVFCIFLGKVKREVFFCSDKKIIPKYFFLEINRSVKVINWNKVPIFPMHGQ